MFFLVICLFVCSCFSLLSHTIGLDVARCKDIELRSRLNMFRLFTPMAERKHAESATFAT